MKWLGLFLVILACTGNFWGAALGTVGVLCVYHGINK